MASLKKEIGDKKAVAIVGMAQTNRHQAPWNVDNCDIWVLNESHAHNYIKRVTRIFQLHPEWDYMRRGNFNDLFYPEFLQNLPWTEEDVERVSKMNTYKKLPRGFPPVKVGKKRRPEDLEIVLLEPAEDHEIPGEKKYYPFGEIMDSYGNNPHVRYFTSSAPYMIALALHEGYEWIGVFGFEMGSETEYGYQKPCMEYWLGRAMERLGDENVYIPKGCSLLGQTTQLYGYDKIPGYTDMHAEIRRNAHAREFKKAEAHFKQIEGRIAQIMNDMKVARQKGDKAWMGKLERQMGAIGPEKDKAIAKLNNVAGALQEADYTWKQIRNLPTTEELRPIIPGK